LLAGDFFRLTVKQPSPEVNPAIQRGCGNSEKTTNGLGIGIVLENVAFKSSDKPKLRDAL